MSQANRLPRSDATRPSFASETNAAISSAHDGAFISTRGEDSEGWLDIDAADFDSMLEDSFGPSSRPSDMDVDSNGASDEERATEQQTAKLQEMAKKVEEFVEGKGDVEGAMFEE